MSHIEVERKAIALRTTLWTTARDQDESILLSHLAVFLHNLELKRSIAFQEAGEE